jgi:hypothetical protein
MTRAPQPRPHRSAPMGTAHHRRKLNLAGSNSQCCTCTAPESRCPRCSCTPRRTTRTPPSQTYCQAGSGCRQGTSTDPRTWQTCNSRHPQPRRSSPPGTASASRYHSPCRSSSQLRCTSRAPRCRPCSTRRGGIRRPPDPCFQLRRSGHSCRCTARSRRQTCRTSRRCRSILRGTGRLSPSRLGTSSPLLCSSGAARPHQDT